MTSSSRENLYLLLPSGGTLSLVPPSSRLELLWMTVIMLITAANLFYFTCTLELGFRRESIFSFFQCGLLLEASPCVTLGLQTPASEPIKRKFRSIGILKFAFKESCVSMLAYLSGFLFFLQ